MEQQLVDFLGHYGYLFVFALTFLECGAFTGLFVPGESVLILSGVLASRGQLSLPLIIISAWAGAYSGDLFGYWLGRRFGRRIILSIARRFGFHQEHFTTTERFFEKYGALAIIGGRFIGIFRSLLPATAGIITYPVKRFIITDLVGSLSWSLFFTLVGYFIGQQWTRYQPYFIAAGAVIVIGTIVYTKVHRTSSSQASQEDTNHSPESQSASQDDR